MDKINELFDQEVIRVNDAFPSIYTKDDVIELLSKLSAAVLNEVPALKPTTGITELQFQEFRSDVRDNLENALNNGSIEMYDTCSAEFSIDYHNVVVLENVEVNTDNITEELDDIILTKFQKHFSEFLISNLE